METDTPLITLASASPRRAELLGTIWPRIRVQPSPLDEPTRRPARVPPPAWCQALAHFKARSVADVTPVGDEHWVLGADTIVVCAGEMLGKPRDIHDARRMLRLQAGRASEVITGVSLLFGCLPTDRFIFSQSTTVWMKEDLAGIERYLQTGDWMGKAGAYGIQSSGDVLVERTDGSVTNVVGLPVEALETVLRRLRQSREPELKSTP